jgi:hypothetical protein
VDWPKSDRVAGMIDLHVLPSVEGINGARIRKLAGNHAIPDTAPIILRTFRAVVSERHFCVGFCLGDAESFSAIGLAVIDRLLREAPDAPLYVAAVTHEDIAWDLVLRHLRSFTGELLLFTFPNSDVYDAGTAEIHFSKDVRQFGPDGARIERLTAAQRRTILARKAEILNRPPQPSFYPATNIAQEDSPWIFRLVTPVGKVIRTAVWNGRRDYAHPPPTDIVEWVGGDKIAIVQVDSPVGINRRSSLDLTHTLAAEFDGVIHWARDSETFQSILRSFIRLDLECVSPPELPEGWSPEVQILAANS